MALYAALKVGGRMVTLPDTAIPNAELAALASEVAQLLRRANDAAERRGLLRLLTLTRSGQGEPDAELWFAGDLCAAE